MTKLHEAYYLLFSRCPRYTIIPKHLLKALIVSRGFITNSENKVLLLQRSTNEKYDREMWELPGGKVGDTEEIESTLFREVYEETGLDVKTSDIIFHYRSINYPHTVYRGLTMVTIIFRCLIKNSEVKICQEHNNFGWFTKEEAQKMNITPPTLFALGKFS